MYSSKDAANPAYPTQWALNPTAYQNVDSSEVDWAALAQQWIAMKDAAAVMAAPPPPSLKPEAEEGEAPMEVESTDTNDSLPPGAEWNASTNSWGGGGWNQWGWGWPGSGGMDPKMGGDPTMSIPPIMEGYTVPPDTNSQMPGYTTGPVPAPTFQHGYWTAPQPDQPNRNNTTQERRSKSKNREHKPPRPVRPPREKVSMVPPVVTSMQLPAGMQTTTIDAAKRRQLPAWIREGLEKMEREKQRAIEREQEKKARELAEIEKKKQEEEELERMKAEAGGQPVLPPKSKFESDSEGEEMEKVEPAAPSPVKEESDDEEDEKDEPVQPLLIKKSKEEIMQEIMLAVRRSLTEILLEVTDQEIHTVSQEEYNRYTTAQATRLNAMKASKSKALAAIASGLGLGAYESSSEGSGDEEEQNERDVSDQQLQDIIRRKRQEFERTAREIEAEVRRAEQREQADEAPTPLSSTPEKPRISRSSATPPPIEGDTPEKIPDRNSKDKKNHKVTDKPDGVRKLDTISEEKPKKPRKDHTPSPKSVKSNNKEHSTTSDSEDDSSSSSSGSYSETEKNKSRKRKRRTSHSSDSQKKKKEKRKKSHKESNSRYQEEERLEKSKSRKKEERHKPSRSREYDRHKDKYREDSEDDRPRKRSRRSRSVSYESRSGRRRSSSRREKRSYERERRDRSYERSREYDRYERSREYDRRRSRSGSHPRHRR